MKCTPVALHAKAPPIPNTLVQPNHITSPQFNHHLALITSVHQHLCLRVDQSLGIQTDTNYSLLYSYNEEYNHTPSFCSLLRSKT